MERTAPAQFKDCYGKNENNKNERKAINTLCSDTRQKQYIEKTIILRKRKRFLLTEKEKHA